MTQKLNLENLYAIRKIAQDLNRFPELCSEESLDAFQPLELAFMKFLWEIDEAIRAIQK